MISGVPFIVILLRPAPNAWFSTLRDAGRTTFSIPQFVLHDDYTLMTSHTVPRLRLDCARFSEAKSGEPVCGDTVSVFESDDRKFYCLLSDGMGSGRDAALTSRLAALMLEKLICIGAEKESALRIMNKAIAEKKTFRVESGDMIVMMSDGIQQTGSAPVLPEYGLPPMPSAHALASRMLREARARGDAADDMSVCVIRVV